MFCSFSQKLENVAIISVRGQTANRPIRSEHTSKNKKRIFISNETSKSHLFPRCYDIPIRIRASAVRFRFFLITLGFFQVSFFFSGFVFCPFLKFRFRSVFFNNPGFFSGFVFFFQVSFFSKNFEIAQKWLKMAQNGFKKP